MTQRSRLVLPTGINDPGATWQHHAPPRPGQRSRLVTPTGTFESLVPVGATNRDRWPLLYTRPFLLPPETPPNPPPLLLPARNSSSTPAGCPILAAVRLAGASPLSWAWSSTTLDPSNDASVSSESPRPPWTPPPNSP